MDAEQTRAEIHGARAQRILQPALHMVRQIRAAPQHLRRWGPIRPFPLGGNPRHAGPGEAYPADADPVADRLAVAEDVVEAPLTRVDNDGARRVPAWVIHRRAGDRR